MSSVAKHDEENALMPTQDAGDARQRKLMSRGARLAAVALWMDNYTLCLLGWGRTQDAYQVTTPRPDGAAARRAIERALRHANLPPAAMGYINAHGMGTSLNDSAAVRAIRGALGPHAERVAVSSIKGAVGHLMAASGAVELAACLLAFERELLPGTANLQEKDPECDLDIIGPEPRPARVDVVLSNSFGLGGQNVTVALGRAA
jgi:3-oxoacyl-[acyl-carrier-protein] synthase II